MLLPLQNISSLIPISIFNWINILNPVPVLTSSSPTTNITCCYTKEKLPHAISMRFTINIRPLHLQYSSSPHIYFIVYSTQGILTAGIHGKCVSPRTPPRLECLCMCVGHLDGTPRTKRCLISRVATQTSVQSAVSQQKYVHAHRSRRENKFCTKTWWLVILHWIASKNKNIYQIFVAGNQTNHIGIELPTRFAHSRVIFV